MENKEELDGILLNETQHERIGFGTRLGAYLLDGLVVLILGSIVGLLIGEMLSNLFFSEQMDQFDQLYDLLGDGYEGFIEKMIAISAGVSLTGLSLFFMEGALGQSFGKMMLGIINTNVDGSKAAPSKLWMRSFLKYGASILTLIGGVIGVSFLGSIGSLWSLIIFIGFFFVFGDNKQTIHDMIAKTVVSYKE